AIGDGCAASPNAPPRSAAKRPPDSVFGLGGRGSIRRPRRYLPPRIGAALHIGVIAGRVIAVVPGVRRGVLVFVKLLGGIGRVGIDRVRIVIPNPIDHPPPALASAMVLVAPLAAAPGLHLARGKARYLAAEHLARRARRPRPSASRGIRRADRRTHPRARGGRCTRWRAWRSAGARRRSA